MSAIAAATGPTIGALLTQYASWRWIFLINVPICAAVVFLGLRTLHERRDPHAEGLPDPLGVLLIAAMPAAVSFSIIEGPRWGWSDGRVIGGFVIAAALLPLFLLRSRVAVRPAIDLALFHVREFRLVNVATLVFAAAFYGTLLSNIIFLQTVWHYSVLRSALANAPGPLVVAVVARISTRLAHRYGPRVVLAVGALFYATALALYATVTSVHPHWLTHWLPIALLLGAGIGMTLPVQSGAAVAALPPERLGVGSAINASFRQLGAVLGISLFVAVLGTPGPAAVLGAYHHVWAMFAVFGAFSGLVVWLPRLDVRRGRD